MTRKSILSLDTKLKTKGIDAASHQDQKEPRAIQAMTMLLVLMSHWLMQNGFKDIKKK